MPADSPDWQAATDVAPVLLGQLSAANGAATASVVVNVPGTATALRLGVGASFGQINALTVTGVTTGTLYLSTGAVFVNGWRIFDCPVAAAIDAQVTVSVTFTGANPGPGAAIVGTILALGANGVQGVYASSSDPLPVYYPTVPTVQLNAVQTVYPQPLLGLTLLSVAVNLTLAAGASSTLVAAVLNQRIRVYGYELTVSPNVGGNIGRYGAILQDTGGTVVIGRTEMLWQTAAGLGSFRSERSIPYGLIVGGTQGIEVTNPATSSGSVNVVGVVDYTQG